MKLKLPGLRILKSAFAVFICLLIGLVRTGGMPFYSAIAAMLCMQKDVASSWKAAVNRVIGTCIGGLAGYLMLLLLAALGENLHPVVRYFLIALGIVVLMYLTVLIKKSSASYITCVVFLSVTISHGVDPVPYLFALNRVIDTIIGIAVSLLINLIPPHGKREKPLTDESLAMDETEPLEPPIP